MNAAQGWKVALGVMSAVLLVASGVLFYLLRGTYQPFGTALSTPKPLANFTATDHEGRARQLSDFQGKILLVFFGFTNCPDVCPTTLLELKKVYERLNSREQERVQVLLISVDPERDTLEQLKAYATGFNPRFLALRGTQEETALISKQFGVIYQKTEIRSPTQYNVAHTASTFMIDEKGRLRLVYGYGRAAQTDLMIEDLRWMINEG